MADARSAAHYALHCSEIPRACSWGSPRPKCACGTSATVRAYGWRVSAQRQSGNDTRGARISGDVCAAGCAVQEGGRAGSGCARRGARCHRGGARHARAVLPCCPDSHAITTTEAVGKLLVPATQHGAGCGVQVCEGVGSRGSLELDARVQHALRTPSPLPPRVPVGKVRWWGGGCGQRTRGDRHCRQQGGGCG